MEHKHDNSGSGQAGFAVTAVMAGPDPDTERLFLLNELERIDGLIAASRKQGWFGRLLETAAAGPSLDQLKRYRHQLGVYGRNIDRFEQDIIDGVMPFRVIVSNLGGRPVRQIRTKVRVTNGSILLTRQPPIRPARIDSEVQHAIEMPSHNLARSLTGGFVRSGVRLGRTSLAAEFSVLESGEEAALVNQTLFLDLGPDTQMEYELSSERGAVAGVVEL